MPAPDSFPSLLFPIPLPRTPAGKQRGSRGDSSGPGPVVVVTRSSTTHPPESTRRGGRRDGCPEGRARHHQRHFLGNAHLARISFGTCSRFAIWVRFEGPRGARGPSARPFLDPRRGGGMASVRRAWPSAVGSSQESIDGWMDGRTDGLSCRRWPEPPPKT